MTRLMFSFLVLVAHGFAQGIWPFGGGSDAKRIQGKAVVAPLTCSDGEQLTWVTANSRFECAAAGGAGSGITTLNTLTGDTQTFATPGTTGTAPNWVSSGTAHTLHIPMASASSVTAGLVTKTWYDTVVTAAGTLTSNAPVIGGGSKAVAVGTASGNTTEFGTISGTKTVSKQLAFDASGNIIASATDIGGSGSGATAVTGLTDNKVTVSGAIYTVAAGVWHCLDSSGVMQAYSLSAGTVERTTGTTAGTLRFGVNCNNGSPIYVARIETAITLGNYTCTGVTCTSADAYADGDWALATGLAGASLGTPTEYRGLGAPALYKAGTGLSKTGDTFSLGSFTIISKIGLPLVACSGTTGTLMWDTLATLAPTATCSAGSTETTMMRGVADFPDSDGDYSVQVAFPLPSDFTSTVDAVFFWRTAATSGNVVWQIQTACRADAEVDDVAWNTASTVTDAAKGTTLQLNTASITSVTITGCAASEIMHVRVLRNRTHASDTMAAAVSLAHVELTTRRTQ